MTRRRRRGYAMALLLVVMTVMTAAVALVLSSAATDAASSRRTAARTIARAVARSGAEEIWARVSSDPNFLTPMLNGSGTVNHPAVGDGRWAKLDNGTASSCTSYREDCYHVDLATASGSMLTTSSLRITVTSRVRCGGFASRCVKARVETRMRRKQFFDYLYFIQYTVLDPRLQVDAGAFPDLPTALDRCADKFGYVDGADPVTTRDASCLSVSFQGQGDNRDQIDGPVYTFDNWISVCGNPQFRKPVSVAGSGWQGAGSAQSQVWRPAPDPVCAASSPILEGAAATKQRGLSMPSTKQTAAQVCSAAGDRCVRTSGTATLTFSTSGSSTLYNLTGLGSDATGTASGVISPGQAAVFLIDQANGTGGNLKVSGTTTGRISVFAVGDLTITGNLTYANGESAANKTDVTGLTSIGGAIVITKSDSDRTIDAVLLSLDQAVRVEGWNTANPSTPPTLTLFGALAAKYQGIFGGYSSATGQLVSGYRKNFLFDTRPSAGGDLQPPYLISPLESVWERLDLTELPAGS